MLMYDGGDGSSHSNVCIFLNIIILLEGEHSVYYYYIFFKPSLWLPVEVSYCLC